MSQELLKIAQDAALLAGETLKKGFGTDFRISSKDTLNNLVTEYDLKSESIIINFIKEKNQNHTFLAEESGSSGKASPGVIRWVIDPIDGTVNFARGIPLFSISIAAELDGDILCGVIYNPISGELFTAYKGGGAYFNGKRMHVSNVDSISTSLLVTGFPYDVNKNPYHTLELFTKVVSQGIPVRRLGSAALDLAYVAKGSFDGFWEVGLKPWDVAAGILLVKEAGGEISQFFSKEYSLFDDTLLATNSLVHNEITNILKSENES